MFAETKKEVLVEYPLDVVEETLVNIFPVKYYKIRKHYPVTHSFRVIDSYNSTFVMHISLNENTTNTTTIEFFVDYPHAVMDLTKGGTQAIETILEELLIELDKKPKTGTMEAQNSDVKVVNADNFVNTTNKTHTMTIVVGYILCFLSIVLPMIALINYNPDMVMFMFFMIGILSLAFEISLSVILQYYEDSQSIFHGRIQICLCGIVLFIMGLVIHPGLAIAGIIIPIITITYFIKRSKSIE